MSVFKVVLVVVLLSVFVFFLFCCHSVVFSILSESVVFVLTAVSWQTGCASKHSAQCGATEQLAKMGQSHMTMCDCLSVSRGLPYFIQRFP